MCRRGYLLPCCWWGGRSGIHRPVSWGAVLTAPSFPAPLRSRVQIRWPNVLWRWHTAAKQEKKQPSMKSGRENDQIRSYVSVACAGMQPVPVFINMHCALLHLPAAPEHEITTVHLSVSRINISLLLKFACKRHILVPCDLNIPSGITCNLLSFYIHCSTLMGI